MQVACVRPQGQVTLSPDRVFGGRSGVGRNQQPIGNEGDCCPVLGSISARNLTVVFPDVRCSEVQGGCHWAMVPLWPLYSESITLCVRKGLVWFLRFFGNVMRSNERGSLDRGST